MLLDDLNQAEDKFKDKVFKSIFRSLLLCALCSMILFDIIWLSRVNNLGSFMTVGEVLNFYTYTLINVGVLILTSVVSVIQNRNNHKPEIKFGDFSLLISI
ncbi:MAG: hypothetical protein ACFCAD_04220 [Pleurocapsa sp.]